MVVGRRLRAHIGLCVALVVALALSASARALPGDDPTLTVDQATVNAQWKEGWLRPGAAVVFTGAVSAPATLRAILRPASRPGVVTAQQTYDVAQAGSFSERLRLPARPLPGPYTLRVTGTSASAPLAPVDLDVALPAPPEGVLDRVLVATSRTGPWQRYNETQAPVVHGTHKEIWMRFRFLYPPTGRHVVLIWTLHWHRLIGKVAKRYKGTIDTYVRSGAPLPHGVWVAVLTIDGRVAKRMDVRLLS
jgi:hypothetical protein